MATSNELLGSILERTQNALARLSVTKESRLILGVSGGVDSVSLAFILRQLLDKELFSRLQFVHINHQLRGNESTDDESFVRQFAHELDVPLEVVRLNTRRTKRTSIELAARNDRYRAFAECAERTGATHVLTAHNADDQVETVLMNLFRGTGIRGLCGIPESRALMHGVTAVRPWLGIWRDEILEVARALNISFRSDSSNASTEFFRNRIRLEILPYLEAQLAPKDIRSGILTMSTNLRAQNRILEQKVEEEFEEMLQPTPPYPLECASVALDLDGLLHSSRESVHGILQISLAKIRGIDVSISSRISQLFFDFVLSEATFKELGARIALQKQGDLLLIIQSPRFEPIPSNQFPLTSGFTLHTEAGTLSGHIVDGADIVKDPNYAYFDAEMVGTEGIAIRNWKPGDKMRPFGMKGTKLVSDILNEAGLRGRDKLRMPIVVRVESGEILWVPGIRASEDYRVKDLTRKTLVLRRSTSGKGF